MPRWIFANGLSAGGTAGCALAPLDAHAASATASESSTPANTPRLAIGFIAFDLPTLTGTRSNIGPPPGEAIQLTRYSFAALLCMRSDIGASWTGDSISNTAPV